MLKIDPRTIAAFEADVLADQRQRFVAWLGQHRAIVGNAPPATAMQILDASREDAAQDGIDTDERLLVFAAARGLMPAMDGVQYLLTMDVVFSPDDDAAKLRRIVAIRDGQHA